MSVDKFNGKSRNQGVTAQTDSEKSQSSSKSKGSSYTSSEKNIDRETSLNKVKDDLKTVIELMGPTTPHLELSSAVEMLDESVYSNESTSRKIHKSKSEVEVFYDLDYLKERNCEACRIVTPAMVQTDRTRNLSTSFAACLDSAGNNFEHLLCSFFELHQEDKTITEDQPLTTDCDHSIVATDNCTIQDTDISMVLDHSLLKDNVPITCICPPPAIPANLVYNSECMCPQMANYIHSYNAQSKVEKKKSEKINVFSNLFKNFKNKKNSLPRNKEYYTINIQQSRKNISPKRLVFELVDKIPEQINEYENELPNETLTCPLTASCIEINDSNCRKNKKVVTRTTKKDGITNDLIPIDSSNNPVLIKKKKFNQKTTYTDLNGATRVDVYYFDHGCSSYFRTTDRSPVIATEDLAEKTEAYTTKFWAELFGSFNIGCSFFISFILQSVRFFLYSILRPLTVGLIQLISDYFFKPTLTTVFNAVIQPILIFFYNIVTSLRDICEPLAEAIGYFIRELAILIRAFRIIEVNTNSDETICNRRVHKKSKFLYRAKTGTGYTENTV